MPRPSRWNDILQAAAEEFREHGYENATLENIGSRVGILKGSIYNYIGSKEELLFAVVEGPAQRLLEGLRLLLDEGDADVPVLVRLHRLFRMQVQIFAEHYPAAFVYLRHIKHPSQKPEFRRMDAEYIAAVERLIADGARRGEFSLPSSPGVAARAIVGMLDWMQHWFRPRGMADDLRLADELFSLALGGLAAGGASRAAVRAIRAPDDDRRPGGP